MLERIARPRPGFADILAGLRGHHLANALVSFLFACTGPVALILTVGIAGGLKPAEIASWISIAFMLGGAITFAMSILYRQPLAMAWTIPGTAIVGAGLLKFPYPEIVGAYVVTGALMLALGLSGAFKKIMDWMPQPIVMAMVAGLFLKFGVLAIDGFDKAPIVAVAATAGFVLFSLMRPLGRFVPPVVAALAAGGVAIAVLGGFHPREGAAGFFADPVFFVPKFSEAALLDLVLPLAISVVVLQNAQGIGILRMNRHDPPPNTITAVCGVGTIAFGLFGAVCACLTGPANAIICTSGEPKNHYIGALIWAAFAVVFGLFAPGITSVALAVPDAFIFVIGGLAMLRVLQQSLAAAFGGKFTAGAVVCLAVTVTELIPEARFALLGIGAPFWGLVFGVAASLLLEPGDFRRPAVAAPAPAPAEPAPPIEEKVQRPTPPVPAWALEPDEKPKPATASEMQSAAEPPPAVAPPTEPAPPSSAPVPMRFSEADTKSLAPLTPPAREIKNDTGAVPHVSPVAAESASLAAEPETKEATAGAASDAAKTEEPAEKDEKRAEPDKTSTGPETAALAAGAEEALARKEEKEAGPEKKKKKSKSGKKTSS
ncbi:MAG TPA: benzoate/H(+) symporter BenE family transporter [Alphaproteobacteria bacterium]